MKIPLFPLDVVLFPGAPLPLHIFEPRYKEMIARCIETGDPFGVVRAARDGLAVIGCTANVVRVLYQYPDGRSDILTQGVERFEIEQLDDSLPYLQAEVDCLPDTGAVAPRAVRERAVALHFEALELLGAIEPDFSFDLDKPLSWILAWSSPADLAFQQQLLALRSDLERTQRLIDYYESAIPKLRSGLQAARRAERNGHVM
jgi:Lon protease-like protein